ncbi:MAG: ferredoxin [Candidatus Brocadia carolinensis]|uniref:Ferredoxin n=1 Tax=Candidatus Brocadia carolinensis TaxID=1004156 RepID=A0A1V4AUY1_9BACT|nr:MAG: ferredoxin [Candidatus Brocadia caroliniensis]
MRAKVDPDICTGCELCTQTCPDVFYMKGDVAEAKNADVSSENEDLCRQAAEECPVEAIIIED